MLYKALRYDGSTLHAHSIRWLLPSDNAPGGWMPSITGALVQGQHGYCLHAMADLPSVLGPTVYEAECRGDMLDNRGSVTARTVRLLRRLPWDDHVARLFACDCAERVLLLYEREHDDKRPRQAIEAARRLANGQATWQELAESRAAAQQAVKRESWWDVLWEVAWDPRWDAERTEVSAIARAAIVCAAHHTKVGPGWQNSDSIITWESERQWQGQRLREYLYRELSDR